MANVKAVEIWLHIHGFKNGLFEVSPQGTDHSRVEIPAHLVERFHTDASRSGKALFRVPEYFVVGIGVYQPRVAQTASVQTDGQTPITGVVSGGTNMQTVCKAEVKPVFDEGRLHREIEHGVFETHNDGSSDGGHGILESTSVVRSPGAKMKREFLATATLGE